jgi:hypothetical protein
MKYVSLYALLLAAAACSQADHSPGAAANDRFVSLNAGGLMRRRKTIRLRRRGEDKDMKFNLRPLLKNNYPELGIIGNGFQAI